MQLRDGSNTISDERFHAAREELWERWHADQWLAAEGRTEELPSEMAARHASEGKQLLDNYKNLSVMEWLKIHPDQNLRNEQTMKSHQQNPRQNLFPERVAINIYNQSGTLEDSRVVQSSIALQVVQRLQNYWQKEGITGATVKIEPVQHTLSVVQKRDQGLEL